MQAEMKEKEIERLKQAGIPITALEGTSNYGLEFYPA